MTVQEWLGEGNTLGIDIWEKKYRYDGESFGEWLDRVSGGNDDIRDLIIKKKYLYGGRILANRGLEKKGRKITLSNCYVITPPEDNIESIFECASKLARTYSYGGGCGIDISELSPKGAKINNAANKTSGSVSFMELYNLVTSLIGQNGRRGALMISISCDHPDVEEFIEIKSDLDKLTKCNISVRITDEFMQAVENHTKHKLIFTREETGLTYEKEIDAYEFFCKLCEMNWDYAEPGILFWDRIEKWNLLENNEEFKYAGVNPCAEEPLPAGGSCLLGAINLAEFVRSDSMFDFEDFKDTVEKAVVGLNDVLDEGLSLHPLAEQRESVRDWRQIGLGIFGLADMLIKMGVRYGSKESIELCDKIGYCLASTAIKKSAVMSYNHEKYPECKSDKLVESSFFKFNIKDKDDYELVKSTGLYNSQLLTIAPTGTLSTMLGVSGGIEPIYANSYERKTESLHGEDRYYKVYTPIVKEYMEANNISDEKDLPEFFVTAGTLDYHERIDMQAVWQKHIDASISSTINLPNKTTVEDIVDLYLYAWRNGLKGVTIFRDGCKRTGVLSTNSESKDSEDSDAVKFDHILPITRKDLGNRLEGATYVRRSACGKLYITVNHDSDGNLVEVFIDSGKSGGCSANAECLGRYASAAMRSGMSIESIVDITKGVKCSACTQVKGSKIKPIDGLSCGDIVARVIEEDYKIQKNKVEKGGGGKTGGKGEKIEKTDEMKCPNCGEKLTPEGGCPVCKNCGWSKCN